MTITIELLQLMFMPMLGAAAAYGAIRADLKSMFARLTALEQRVNDHIEQHSQQRAKGAY